MFLVLLYPDSPVGLGMPMIREGTLQDVPALARLRTEWTAQDSMDRECREPTVGFEDAIRSWLACGNARRRIGAVGWLFAGQPG